MTCPDCTAASERGHHGFRAECMGCCARAAARGPHYRRCRDAGVQDRAYRQMLEQFGLTHQQAQDAATSDALVEVK